MECAAKCGTNSTCTFYCSETYQDPSIDNMMRCMFVDYECLSLPDPDPINNATCRKPSNTVKGIDTEGLAGLWYVNTGFNELYDCFACQESTFLFNQPDVDAPIEYQATYNIINVEGNEQWNHVEMTGSESSPGVISLYGTSGGLDNYQDWYFMYQSEETALAYYCGDTLTWHFEGMILLTRDGEIHSEDLPGV